MKSDKGSITVYVLIAMLTLIAFLMAIYSKSANTQIAQIETTQKIKSIYEDYDINEVYETMIKSIPEILGYTKNTDEANNTTSITIKTLIENGANVDQNGREILYYAATYSNTAPNSPKDNTAIAEGEFGVWQKSKKIELPSGIKNNIYIWIMNEDGMVSKPLKAL